MKILLFFLLSLSCIEAQTLTLDLVQAPKSLDRTHYNISKVVSIFPGFGLGHAIQGRWLDKGWVFTVGEFLSLGSFITSYIIIAMALSGYVLHGGFHEGWMRVVFYSSLPTYLGLKTYSAIDIWKAPGYKIENSSYQSPYYLSGFISIFPGFGLGHAIQGRWLDKGWVFAVGELLSIGGIIFAGRDMYDEANIRSTSSSSWLVFAVSVTAFIVLRKLEVNDVWGANSQYKIGKSPRLDLQPVFSMNALKGNDFGLSLKYSF